MISQVEARCKTVPLRYVSELNPPVSFSGLGENEEVTFLPMDKVKDGYYLANTASLSAYSSSYNAFAEGDILLAKVTPCFENGNIAIADNLVGGKGFGSSELFVLRPNGITTGFLFYALQSPVFKQTGEASMEGAGGLKRVSPEALRNFRLWLPAPTTQQAVVALLDRETARIDALIAAKERALGLLAEKRRALITRAVTRGIDPSAPLRDSGIPWLGSIPAHWQISRAKWMFTERDERSPFGEEILLSLRMDRGLVPHNDVSNKPTRPEELIGYKKTSPGELVINRMRAAAGLIAVSPREGLVSPDYAVFVPSPAINIAYYMNLFSTSLLGSVFRASSSGMGTGTQGFLRLYSDAFLQLWFPSPPLAEQRAIVDHIARETAKLDALRAATERSIALLKERRAALIAAAVTGQVRIGGG